MDAIDKNKNVNILPRLLHTLYLKKIKFFIRNFKL